MIIDNRKVGRNVAYRVLTDQYRVDWPFYRMKVGDVMEFKGEKAHEMKVRAVAAANHYKITRGYQFRSKKIHNKQYIVWRDA